MLQQLSQIQLANCAIKPVGHDFNQRALTWVRQVHSPTCNYWVRKAEQCSSSVVQPQCVAVYKAGWRTMSDQCSNPLIKQITLVLARNFRSEALCHKICNVICACTSAQQLEVNGNRLITFIEQQVVCAIVAMTQRVWSNHHAAQQFWKCFAEVRTNFQNRLRQ